MSATPLRPGARFGRYIVDRVLGSGTFGVVYAARREDLPRPVALKVLHAELTHLPEVVRRFRAEAQTIAALRHPHIVDVNDVGEHQGAPFLAMELLDGETLRDRLEREGTLPLEVALDVLLPVFSAVSAVHAKGIVHRDIKPDNIVLATTRPGRVDPKLLDFGVAKVVHEGPSMTRTGAAIGTPYYMSPEQAEESREVGAASDQWALAVLLYRSVTGQYPFQGRSVVKIFHAIVEDPPLPPSVLLPSCPLAVERAILRALSKQPEERFPSVSAFGAALFPFASRRSREDWSEEFVDAEAATIDLLPPPPPSRPQTQQGPTFHALASAAAARVTEPDLYEEDIKTDVHARPAGAAPGTGPIVPAPVAPLTPFATMAAAPPSEALQAPWTPQPVYHPGTLSLSARVLLADPEGQRLRKRVVLAGVVAAASVIACVVVVLDRHRAPDAPVRTVLYDMRRASTAAPALPAAPPPAPSAPLGAAPAPVVPGETGDAASDPGRARGRRGVRADAAATGEPAGRSRHRSSHRRR